MYLGINLRACCVNSWHVDSNPLESSKVCFILGPYKKKLARDEWILEQVPWLNDKFLLVQCDWLKFVDGGI